MGWAICRILSFKIAPDAHSQLKCLYVAFCFYCVYCPIWHSTGLSNQNI